MYFTGIADEAARDIDGQIRATKELGWRHLEARSIDGTNIHDLSDEAFDAVYGKLQEAGIHVNAFSSTIANWGKRIDAPFDSSLEEARRAIPRMKRLGTRLIRIMSFALLENRGPDLQMEEERFRRLRVLVNMFSDEGLLAVHENCMNYGGIGWPYTLKLLENVPGLKLVFDTGNPAMSVDLMRDPPDPKPSSWEFYSHVKEHIAYVHIKDGVLCEERKEPIFTFPGEGDGDVRRILEDLLADGYDGGLSIEPHMVVVFHDTSIEAGSEEMYRNYVEYGRRLMRMVEEIRDRLND
jgi:sugar phosphate isomerase/epimerase